MGGRGLISENLKETEKGFPLIKFEYDRPHLAVRHSAVDIRPSAILPSSYSLRDILPLSQIVLDQIAFGIFCRRVILPPKKYQHHNGKCVGNPTEVFGPWGV